MKSIYEKPLAELICFELESVRMIKLISKEVDVDLAEGTAAGKADVGDLT